jgi:hypothetical protein
MKSDVEVLKDIPCFKCLFWDWKKESHLHCNPNECEELTKWLLKQAEICQPKEENMTIITTNHVKMREKAKPQV